LGSGASGVNCLSTVGLGNIGVSIVFPILLKALSIRTDNVHPDTERRYGYLYRRGDEYRPDILQKYSHQ
jgi:hypothetical protein